MIGVGLALIGAVMLFLGWYGVSGRPNLAEQMPYIASGTVPGAALVIAAAVLLVGASAERTAEQTNAMTSELHSLLVEDVNPAPDPASVEASAAGATAEAPTSDQLVAVEGGEHFHRADCVLASGKPQLHTVDRSTIDRDDLAPCPVCEPERPG